MKTITLISFIGLACAILNGCTSKTTTGDIITLNIDKVTVDSLDISEFIDSISYIDLKFPDDEFIGRVLSVRTDGSHIIVKDNYKQSPVLLFDCDGNFIKRIGRKGQGPGEYVVPEVANIYNDTIYILDNWISSVHKYDLNGRYVDKDSVGGGYDFAVTHIDGKKYYLLANYNDRHDDVVGVFLIDPLTHTKRKILDRRDKLIDHNRTAEFSFNNGSVRTMTNDYEFKAMRMDNDSLVCEYEFDVTPIPPKSEIDNWTPGYDKFVNYFTRTAYWDTGRWVYLFFSKIDNSRIVLFDKKNNTYQVARSFKNNIDDTRYFWFQPVVIDGKLLGVTIPEDDENPRLMLAHLKE